MDDAIQAEPLSFVATAAKGKVSALLRRRDEARWLLVFGHGAGTGMRHPFMRDLSSCLAGAAHSACLASPAATRPKSC